MMNITLSEDQEAAAGQFLGFLLNPDVEEMVLSGSAGTGKTTLMRHLLELLREQGKITKLLTSSENKLNVYMTSTTNKAARVLREITGEHEVTTIHSLLGLKPVRNYSTGVETFKRSANSDVIRHALIIIDEASMINAELLAIIRKSTIDCKILYVGDRYQLPPVFENECAVFETVPVQSELVTIQRQVAGSPIITHATSFREVVRTSSKFPEIYPDGDAIQYVSKADFQDMINQAYKHPHKDDDYRIVAWRNSQVMKYNRYVRSLFTSNDLYQKGERVLVNNAIIAGDGSVLFRTDQVATISDSGEAVKEFNIWGNYVQLGGSAQFFVPFNWDEAKAYLNHLAKHKDWESFFKLKDFFCDIRPIHANSVHKSQGSTYGTVFVDLTDIGRNTKDYEIARLLYVAISRASERVVMTGTLPKRLYE